MSIRAFAAAIIFSVGLSANASAEDPTEKTGALAEMTLGAVDAPVTMIEYASVTCNHCADWHADVFPNIKENYIDTGKVRFILREMPVIPAHPALVARSYAGTMLARCAADKGGSEAYFNSMSELFAQQETWAFGEDPRGELLKIGAGAGIDEAAFDACLQRADLKAHIDENVTIAADEFKIQGTPGFIIEGEYIRVFSFEDLSKALDEAIEKAIDKARAGGKNEAG